jgi:hypothetical protein
MSACQLVVCDARVMRLPSARVTWVAQGGAQTYRPGDKARKRRPQGEGHHELVVSGLWGREVWVEIRGVLLPLGLFARARTRPPTDA